METFRSGRGGQASLAYLLAGLGATAVFFAQSGSATVTTATQDPDNGTVDVTATSLKLVEWDLTSDTAVTNGRCYEIPSVTMNHSWLSTADMAEPVDMATNDMATGNCTPVVNEVMTADTTASDEFIEIYNPCGMTMDLVNRGTPSTLRSLTSRCTGQKSAWRSIRRSTRRPMRWKRLWLWVCWMP